MTQYKQIIGSLMYLTNKRPDICFDVNTLSQYLVKPIWVHLIVAKHVMRYSKGRIEFGLYYDRDHDYRLYGYTDSDWERSAADRNIRGNLGSKMGLIRKRANNKFCELESRTNRISIK